MGSPIEKLIELVGDGRKHARDKKRAGESQDRSDGDHYDSFFHDQPFMTSRTTWPLLAPRAMRMPISLHRRATA